MTVAVLAIKPFAIAKQRLRPFPGRRELAAWMAAKVIRAATDAQSVDRVLVVTADPLAASLARAARADVVVEPSTRGHNAAAQRGVARACELRAEEVLLLATDCPLVTARAIDELITEHCEIPVVICVDRHGTGTNALLLRPPRVIEPGFGPGSRVRHARQAAAAGVASLIADIPCLAHDVDTPADLADLRARMPTDPGAALPPLRSIV